MKKPSLLTFGPLLVLLLGHSLLSQERLRVETNVSQTSLWPGDRVVYEVSLTIPEGVRVALEDFDAANVDFAPFVLIRRDQSQETLPSGSELHQFQYLLANYETGDRQLEIPALLFRYDDSTVTETNEPTTKERQVPAFPIAIRTTLNGTTNELWIRESLSQPPIERRIWPLTLAALVALLVGSLPLGLWVWRKIPDWQAMRLKQSRRKFIGEFTQGLGSLQSNLKNENADIKEQYGTLQQLVQRYITYFWNLPVEGLTAKEMGSKLEALEIPANQEELLISVTQHGQECCYSAAERSQWEKVLGEDLRKVKQAYA